MGLKQMGNVGQRYFLIQPIFVHLQFISFITIIEGKIGTLNSQNFGLDRAPVT